MSTYIVVGSKPWNRELFYNSLQYLSGKWYYTEKEEELFTLAHEETPRYIFFLHWSKMVPEWVTENYECVCFHPTNLPFGRGGTPLQNLILNKYFTTVVTAFRMTQDLDAGPIYVQSPCFYLEGNAHAIFIRIMDSCYFIIKDIIESNLQPEPQEGEPFYFKRRTPEQSDVYIVETLVDLYDLIRALDAPTYPHAFFDNDKFHFEFSNAGLQDGKIIATVEITEHE